MAGNENILEIHQLYKNFYIRGQKFEVLAGVDLTVKKGEMVAIVGASGCGKSTLLKLITTLESISSGEILLDGEPVNGPSPKCSMIFQEARLFPWLSVRQNIEFVISDAVPKAEKKEMVEYYINLVGLSEFTDAVPNQLSGGMQQRVSIARALATRPQLLLLDEPFGALDVITRGEMQDWLLSMRERLNRTVLLVTHDMDEAIYLSDRILILNGSPARITWETAISEKNRTRSWLYSQGALRQTIYEKIVENHREEIH